MTHVDYRLLGEADLEKLADIDRRERIRTGYEVRNGELVQIEVDWDVPAFLVEGEGEHTLTEQIAFCRRHLGAGARMWGALEGDRLVGVGVVTPEVRPGTAQLAYLQVSHGYRRRGIATRLLEELLQEARRAGAQRMVVSATPSESAVGFYRRHGFAPVEEPLPELFDLEPEDIHMSRRI